MSLVRFVTAAAMIGYGVNVWDQDPPGAIRPATTNMVGVVLEAPWGPTNEPVLITSLQQLLDTFFPVNLGSVGMRAYSLIGGQRWPAGLYVVRVEATGAAAATKTFQSDLGGTPKDSVICAARFKGEIGNEITIEWAENADDATAMDAIVRGAGGYEMRWPAVVESDGTVKDPGDPYVTFTKATGSTAPPDVQGPVALESGSDGTAVAADYTGSATSEKGIRCFYREDVPVNILFVGDCPTSLVANVNAALKAWGADTGKGIAVLSTPSSESVSAFIARASAAASDRCIATNRVRVVSPDPNLGELTIDGNSFVASVLANTDPEVSPGGPRRGRDLLSAISGTETSYTTAELDRLQRAGCAVIVYDPSLPGAYIRGGVTTSTESGRTLISRRRMADFLTQSISRRLQWYVEERLDVDLGARQLGEVTAAEIGEINAFLADLRAANRIRAYEVNPFNANTPASLNAGRFGIIVKVQTFAPQMEIVLLSSVGEGVVITTEAA